MSSLISRGLPLSGGDITSLTPGAATNRLDFQKVDKAHPISSTPALLIAQPWIRHKEGNQTTLADNFFSTPFSVAN